jgi:hypothetical protein
MSVCEKYSIPHSTFMAWDEVDQAKALAFLLHASEKCSLCGTAEWEWDEDQGGSRFAYEPVEKVCMGCYKKHDMGEGGPGAFVMLEPTGTPESAKRFVEQERAHLRRAAARNNRE